MFFAPVHTYLEEGSKEGLPQNGALAEFLLKWGREFLGTPLPLEVQRGMVKFCFINAYRLATSNPEFEYCEGFAASSSGFPVEHAWIADHKGSAYDPTWRQPAAYYFGVAIKKTYLEAVAIRSKMAGALFNWKDDFRLVRGVDKAEECLLPIQART
jgi:hypothetical protein